VTESNQRRQGVASGLMKACVQLVGGGESSETPVKFALEAHKEGVEDGFMESSARLTV